MSQSHKTLAVFSGGRASRFFAETQKEIPHLTPALSAPKGGEGEKARPAGVLSPPFRGERDREGWGGAGLRHAR